MHILFERRRPGHASLFDRGLVSPVRCRKHVLNYRGMLLNLLHTLDCRSSALSHGKLPSMSSLVHRVVCIVS